MDVNNDSILSQHEVVKAFKDLEIGLDDSEITELVLHADQNKDGFLTYREFVRKFAETEDEATEDARLEASRRALKRLPSFERGGGGGGLGLDIQRMQQEADSRRAQVFIEYRWI